MIKSDLLIKMKDELEQLWNMSSNEQYLFISLSDGVHRASVWNTYGKDFRTMWNKTENYLNKKALTVKWIKFDLVTSIDKVPIEEALKQIQQVSKINYFRKGIAFNEDLSISFLEEEINGHFILKPHADFVIGQKNPQLSFDERNLRDYMNKKYPQVFTGWLNTAKYLYLFDTVGLFFDENGKCYHLNAEGIGHGVREVNNDQLKANIDEVLTDSCDYLERQLNQEGKFTYGYYPCFGATLTSYNTVRHFSTLYAWAETLGYLKDSSQFDLVKKGLEWGKENYLIEGEDGYLYVNEPSEKGDTIKLGAQAMAVLAFTEYMKRTKDHAYVDIVEKLVNTLLDRFILPDGDTVHLLDAKGQVKEKFVIVYYDGELVLALMRAYPFLKKDRLLDVAESVLLKMKEKNYQKYHDHWLAYAINEFDYYRKDADLIEFGIENCLSHAIFISERDTSYPTLLELTNATYQLIDRNISTEVTKEANIKNLELVTHLSYLRAYRALIADVMYPERAMYFKYPSIILGGFCIRHDKFRMRIDDAQHFMSGLVNYSLNHF